MATTGAERSGGCGRGTIDCEWKGNTKANVKCSILGRAFNENQQRAKIRETESEREWEARARAREKVDFSSCSGASNIHRCQMANEVPTGGQQYDRKGKAALFV